MDLPSGLYTDFSSDSTAVESKEYAWRRRRSPSFWVPSAMIHVSKYMYNVCVMYRLTAIDILVKNPRKLILRISYISGKMASGAELESRIKDKLIHQLEATHIVSTCIKIRTYKTNITKSTSVHQLEGLAFSLGLASYRHIN